MSATLYLRVKINVTLYINTTRNVLLLQYNDAVNHHERPVGMCRPK